MSETERSFVKPALGEALLNFFFKLLRQDYGPDNADRDKTQHKKDEERNQPF